MSPWKLFSLFLTSCSKGLTGLLKGTAGTSIYENGLCPDGLCSFCFSGDSLDSCPSSDSCCVTPNKPLSFTLIITQIISENEQEITKNISLTYNSTVEWFRCGAATYNGLRETMTMAEQITRFHKLL